MKNLNPGWNRIVRVNGKLNESKKTKLEARQKQIKTKMTVVNKKLKLAIFQRVHVISLLLIHILAAVEYYKSFNFVSRVWGWGCLS